MKYNSFIFILLFMPAFLVIWFISNKINAKFGRWIIIVSGGVFYGFAGMDSFKILMISIALNYTSSLLIIKISKRTKTFLVAVLTANVGLLLYYKYLAFAINRASSDTSAMASIVMPLGISFFTFQQIMYVVGVYKGEIYRADFVDYLAYIMFFPKLIMGPIMEPSDLISQINDLGLRKMNWDNIATGIKLFGLGLFKKMVLADTFAKGVECGFGNIANATAADLLLTMLFYTFEIYFDFSGYTDMATGVSKMINIELPMNFDSPYKATSIRDFWKRWHISLTKFFTNYIYYPLGGNRKGKIRTYVNIMIVFLVSGLWHGSNYTFILWGGLHGILQIIERLFDKYYVKLSEIVCWIYTFGAVNVLWLLFRSDSIRQWCIILKKIFGFGNTAISDEMIDVFNLPEAPLILRLLHLTRIEEHVRGFWMLLFISLAFIICLVPENNYRSQKKRNIGNMMLASVAFVWGFMSLSSESVFVYFNF